MEPTRRGFLKGLGLLIGALAAEPVAEILVPERKIWVVGAKLQSGVVFPKPRMVMTPTFDVDQIAPHPMIVLPEHGQVLVSTSPTTAEWVQPKLITEYLQTKEGREKLAASMAAPLRTRLDYSGIGRRVFKVEQYPDRKI